MVSVYKHFFLQLQTALDGVLCPPQKPILDFCDGHVLWTRSSPILRRSRDGVRPASPRRRRVTLL